MALLVGAAALVLLAGCGPVHLVANTNIPTPLVTKIPIAVALFIPQEFSQYVHKEERASTDWRVEIGRAQTEGITRLMSAMFERVVPVDSVAAGSALGSDVRAILEPSIEEYAFVTPRDAGSPFFAVSIKYRVNVYTPDGKLAESWGFTGYGTSPSQGLSNTSPLAAATALAMRDAGAKLAVEFREQAVVRGLVPDSPTPDALTKSSQETSSGAAPGAGGQGPAVPPAQSHGPAQPEQKSGDQKPGEQTPGEQTQQEQEAGTLQGAGRSQGQPETQTGAPAAPPIAAPASVPAPQQDTPSGAPDDSAAAPPGSQATQPGAGTPQPQSEAPQQPAEEPGPERLLAPRA